MPKFTIPPEATVSDILAALDQWAVDNQESTVMMHLWDVFAGLRGPDRHEDNQYKGNTTANLRGIALPKFAELAGMEVNSNVSMGTIETLCGWGADDVSGHFACHVRWAAQVLRQVMDERGIRG